MAQEARKDSADDVAAEGWEFELGETVNLLWLPTAGAVIGRTEYCHQDAQYLVEFVNTNGELVKRWVYDIAIDHVTTRH